MNNEEKKVNNEELKEELNREGSAAEEKEAESAGTGDGDRTGEFKEAAEAEKTAEPEETGKSGGAESVAAAETTEEDEALNTKYMRLMADFQNYKRRVEKEKSDIYAFANEKLVSEQLAVIDNFERALMVETADTGFAEGMKLIFKQLTDVLEKAGLEEIKAHGEDFDPNFHNAVMTEDNPEFESGKVTEVLQKGYMLNKKVIRPSMVKVNN